MRDKAVLIFDDVFIRDIAFKPTAAGASHSRVACGQPTGAAPGDEEAALHCGKRSTKTNAKRASARPIGRSTSRRPTHVAYP